jgi:hypothetical protein
VPYLGKPQDLGTGAGLEVFSQDAEKKLRVNIGFGDGDQFEVVVGTTSYNFSPWKRPLLTRTADIQAILAPYPLL